MGTLSILDLIEKAGPLAIAVLAVAGLIWERKESKAKSDKLLELATQQIQTMSGVESAVVALEKVMAEVLRRM